VAQPQIQALDRVGLSQFGTEVRLRRTSLLGDSCSTSATPAGVAPAWTWTGWCG